MGDHEDVADAVLTLVLSSGRTLRISDAVSGGILTERLVQRLRETRRTDDAAMPIEIETLLTAPQQAETWFQERLAPESSRASRTAANASRTSSGAMIMVLAPNSSGTGWKFGFRSDAVVHEYEIDATMRFPLTSERARKYVVEKVLHIFQKEVSR